jgi:hypothetical protein
MGRMENPPGSNQDHRNIAYLSARSNTLWITHALALQSALMYLMSSPPQVRSAMTMAEMQALVSSEISRIGPITHKRLSEVDRRKMDTNERTFWEALRGFSSMTLREAEDRAGL